MNYSASFCIPGKGLLFCLSAISLGDGRRSTLVLKKARGKVTAEVRALDMTAMRSCVLGLMKQLWVYQKMIEIR